MSDDVLNGSTTAEYQGDYPEIAAKFKSGAKLNDEELDTVADVALSVIRSILSYFDVENISIDEYDGEDGELIFDVNGDNLAVLIGRHGRTLESLQSLFTLLVNRKLGFRFPVAIDIEGYKSRRREKVMSMARSAASRAIKQHGSVSLSPMPAYERRLVHIALRDNSDVETHSEGVDPERRVVIVAL